MMIPILPSQDEFNKSLEDTGIDLKVGEPKQFAVECFDSKVPQTNKFYRIDNQVDKLVQSMQTPELQKALQQLTNRIEKLQFADKLIGFGHSGAGAAMMRYHLIHPESFDTIIIGGNGDILPTPLGENGEKLQYPFGIADFLRLFGKEFNVEAYKETKQYYYIGELEDKPEEFKDGFKLNYDTISEENYAEGRSGPRFCPKNIAENYKEIYGDKFLERLKNVCEYLEKTRAKIFTKVYEGDCHFVISEGDWHKIFDSKEEENPFEGSMTIKELYEKRMQEELEMSQNEETMEEKTAEENETVNSNGVVANKKDIEENNASKVNVGNGGNKEITKENYEEMIGDVSSLEKLEVYALIARVLSNEREQYEPKTKLQVTKLQIKMINFKI